jgi:uncharacterized cupredoxin-like copper-binding protein
VNRLHTVLAPALAALLLAGGCAVGGGNASPGTVVHVTEKDFTIRAPAQVRAGPVRIVVHNEGPETHELLIVRSQNDDLPLRPDGTTLDEETLQPELVAQVEGAPSGATNEVDVDLEPGRYSLFCNMSGHYLGGMHAVLVVVG